MYHQNEVQEVARLHKGVRHRHYLLIMLLVNNAASGQVRGNQVHQVTPQVSPNVQQNLFAPPTQSNSFPPPPYFPIPFPPPPVPPSNVSIAPSAPAIRSVCSYIPDDKCCQPRKRKHDDHHRCITEDHDTVCGRIAANYTDRSECTSRRKWLDKHG